MEQMIAVCGLDCATCDARLATVANDQAAKARVAAEWRAIFHSEDINEQFVTCEGCHSTDGVLSGYCGMCPIRTCATRRGLTNCGHCSELDSCETYGGMFKDDSPAKKNLLKIRASWA